MKNLKEIDIAKKLIRCRSIAPKDDGALGIVEKECKSMGFKCTKLKFSEKGYPSINNLYAQIGNGKPHFSFAGHVDVVPANKKEWSVDPFKGQIKKKFLIGRGAVDMKSAVACFLSAARSFLDKDKNFKGSISLLITSDEETFAVNGTKKILKWLKKREFASMIVWLGSPLIYKLLVIKLKLEDVGVLTEYLQFMEKQAILLGQTEQ